MGTKQVMKAVTEAGAKAQSEVPTVDQPMGAAERMAMELARVRAKFGMDPTDAREPLDEAWMSPTAMEEDEAEFVDAVADCLGAGLPLEAALSCWGSGELAYEAQADDEDTGGPTLTALGAHHAPAGRRLFVR